jgi:hypothetical protein
MVHEIHTYADLLQKIHDDLRIQHPEWIQQNGESPMCDSYEARLMELLGASIQSGRNETSALPPAPWNMDDAKSKPHQEQIEALSAGPAEVRMQLIRR